MLMPLCVCQLWRKFTQSSCKRLHALLATTPVTYCSTSPGTGMSVHIKLPISCKHLMPLIRNNLYALFKRCSSWSNLSIRSLQYLALFTYLHFSLIIGVVKIFSKRGQSWIFPDGGRIIFQRRPAVVKFHFKNTETKRKESFRKIVAKFKISKSRGLSPSAPFRRLPLPLCNVSAWSWSKAVITRALFQYFFLFNINYSQQPTQWSVVSISLPLCSLNFCDIVLEPELNTYRK